MGTGGSGRVSVAVMAGVSFGWGRRPPVWPGTAVPGYAAGSPLFGGVRRGDQLELADVVVRGEPLERGG